MAAKEAGSSEVVLVMSLFLLSLVLTMSLPFMGSICLAIGDTGGSSRFAVKQL